MATVRRQGLHNVILLILTCCEGLLAIKWLSLDVAPDHKWTSKDCTKQNGLAHRQWKICRQNPLLMKFVADSAQLTKNECREQMRTRLWNCSTINKAPTFGFDLKGDTKESAFVHSLASAALTFTVSKACLQGKIRDCSCAKKSLLVSADKAEVIRERDFGGCPDLMQKGLKFTKQFVNAGLRKKKGDHSFGAMKIKLKRHNSKVGRQMVKEMLAITCRCHGVTGSCSSKHCIKRLPTFQEVAEKLVDKYDKAVQVSTLSERSLRSTDNTHQSELVYHESSPDYCRHDKGLGTEGTRGRECSRTSNGPDNCDKMCCGRGSRVQLAEIEERCQCKYVWCCYVQCKTCKRTRIMFTCK